METTILITVFVVFSTLFIIAWCVYYSHAFEKMIADHEVEWTWFEYTGRVEVWIGYISNYKDNFSATLRVEGDVWDVTVSVKDEPIFTDTWQMSNKEIALQKATNLCEGAVREHLKGVWPW